MSRMILITDLPINVPGLISTLYEMYCSGKQCNLTELQKVAGKEAMALKANVKSATVKNFLLQLKPVFAADGDSQHQLLITQIIKEALEKPERELFSAQLEAISTRIISKRMKEIIFKDLN